jgi:membrane fusion protein, multidrug efflux system
MIPIAATANAARRASSSFFSEGVGKWKKIRPAHEGKHSESGEALNLNLDLNNLRALFGNSCAAASKEFDQFLFLLGVIMNPFVVTAKAAYQSPSSFFSEDIGSGGFSLKLIKSSATKLFRCARWMTLAVCTFSTGCKQSTQAPALPPPPVTVATPILKEIVEWDEYTGRTQAVESVDIRPRVSGYIDRISFKDGQPVKPGDVLFVIDPRPYQDVLDQASANLESADAQRQLQMANLTRAEKLFQNNVTAKEQYDTSVAERNHAVAQFSQARASVNSARLNVEFTEVKSPIQGRISRQLVTRGNLVQADSTVLTKVVSIDPIYAYFNVDERTVQKYHNQMQSGQLPDPRVSAMPLYLQLEGETGFPHEGVIDFVDNTYNASTGTLQIRGRFKNDDASLYPDAFVRVRIAGTPKHQAVLITDRAVATDQGQKFVLSVDDNSVVQVRPVELGPVVDGLRVVRKGLGPDDHVIVNGLVNARPGSKVTAQPGDMNQFLAGQSAPVVSVSAESQSHNGQGDSAVHAKAPAGHN